MSLFVIADLHLSLGKSKPMEIFMGWDNHVERLTRNWNAVVRTDDTVVIAGDISWAQNLTDALPDLEYIDNVLNGRKIIIKGNHDYWWTSLSKLNNCGFTNISFLHRNAYLIGGIAVCGTRGWLGERGETPEKLQKREAGRLEASARQAVELGASEIIAFLHYPPIHCGQEDYEIIDVLQRFNIRRCYYGHLHGHAQKNAVTGTRYGVEFNLIAADFVSFTPQKIEKY